MIYETGGKLQLSFSVLDGFHFMRKFVSYIGIILLALLVSGWGSVLAVALCPHAGMNQALPVTEDHSCHSTKLETTSADHQQAAHHEAALDLKVKPVAVPQLHSGGHAAIGKPSGNCAHCVGQSEFPAAPASVRELTLQKTDEGKLVLTQTPLAALPAAAVSVSRFVPSQHAPPWLAARKQLILCVFLI
jgi:hypothetical protein